MKLFMRCSLLYIIVLAFLFSSCTKNDISSISLSKPQINLKLGLSDSLNIVMNYSGEITKIPLNISAADSKIVLIKQANNPGDSTVTESTYTRKIIFKAQSIGSTTILVQAGSQTTSLTVNVTQTTLTLNHSTATNYGLALENSDNNVFTLYLLPSTLSLNDTTHKISGNGKFICIECFVPPSKNTIPAETFNVSSTLTSNTFLPGYFYSYNGTTNPGGTYVVDINNNGSNVELIKGGSFSVSTYDSSYLIEGDIITSTNEVIHFYYDGTMPITDRAEKPSVITPNFTKGQLYFVGDYYNMSLSNTFIAYIETKNVNLDDSVLNGELLILQLNSDLSVTNYMLSGDYKMLSQSYFSEYWVIPFSLVPGYTFKYSNGNVYSLGCWYYNSYSRRKLIAGKVSITRENDGSYIIVYSLSDRIGTKISGTFNGSLNYTSLRGVKSNIKSNEASEGISHRNTNTPTFNAATNRLHPIISKYAFVWHE